MKVTRRVRTAGVAAGLLAVMVPAGASAAQRSAGVDVARTARTQGITTTVAPGKHSVVVIARGRLLTLALQVAGTETWTDATGTHVTPLSASPSNVNFGKFNEVRATFPLHGGATVALSYTAEGANLVGSDDASVCYGGTAIFDGGSWWISSHPC